METVSYKHALDLFAAITPVTLENDALSMADATSFNRLFNRIVRKGWEWLWWPQLMNFEERLFRDSWAAGDYAAGAEVWSEEQGLYYVALEAATSADVPGVAAAWEEMTQIDAYVEYEQIGKTAFSQVQEVWSANYRTTRPALRLPWEYDERGIHITAVGGGQTVWVRFRRKVPTFRGATWASDGTYAAGNIRYFASGTDEFEGDFWECVTATSAAESPITHPAKWSKLEIPAFLLDFAVHGAKIGFTEGETELSAVLMSAEGRLWELLYDERDKLQRGTRQIARSANL